ncbi:chemotaxis protein CheD [candidate division KSB1 bacterium 4484_87]|nr:MAG: chemotaxis protein CheD [candidate division KSB1 bacterium 4484_87]
MQKSARQIEESKEHFLFPGNIFVSGESHWVTTILGSCVSVCLWDPARKIGGINHFLLPFWNGLGLASPKYGNIAIEKLIEKILRKGCNIENLRAKIFGGAAILQSANNEKHIGLKNIALAKEYLESKKIPIVASDVGGIFGRRIKFNTSTGVVLVKKIVKAKKRA